MNREERNRRARAELYTRNALWWMCGDVVGIENPTTKDLLEMVETGISTMTQFKRTLEGFEQKYEDKPDWLDPNFTAINEAAIYNMTKKNDLEEKLHV